MAELFQEITDIRFEALKYSGDATLQRWGALTGKKDGWREFTLDKYFWYPDCENSVLKSLITSFAPGNTPEFFSNIFGFLLNFPKTVAATPRMKLYEFQPQPFYRQFLTLFTEIYDFANKLFPAGDTFKLDPTIFNELKKKFSYQSLIDSMSAATQNDALLYSFPKFLYKNLIAGEFLGSFELPYYGTDFIHAKGMDGWQNTTFMKKYAQNLTGILDRFGLGGLNVPITPQFTFDGGWGPECDEITNVVYLYNDTLKRFIVNTDFIIFLTMGALWVQSGPLQRGSNLYQVVIPGRMRYYLCKMDVHVETVGKQRRANATGIDYLKKSTLLPKVFCDETGPSIPDGYKITTKIQSLLPNNFNAFMFALEGEAGFGKAGDVNKNAFQSITEYIFNGTKPDPEAPYTA